jgi:hypothetical protein
MSRGDVGCGTVAPWSGLSASPSLLRCWSFASFASFAVGTGQTVVDVDPLNLHAQSEEGIAWAVRSC